MPLSIDHFQAAATQYPDAEALVALPEKKGIASAKAPRMGVLSIFGIGSYFDELEKSRAIVNDFKAALLEKYGEEVADFVFPSELEGEAATSSLKSRTVKTVLQQAEILDLLKQAIIETITDEYAEPEPEDSPLTNVPGEAQRIFPKATIEAVKKAYYDSLEAASKVMLRGSREFRLHSIPSVREAQQLVQEDLRRARLGQFSGLISEYFPVKAMRAAMEGNDEIREIIFAPVKPPVQTQAAYVRPAQPRSIPMADAMRATASNPSSPIAQAVPLTNPQHAAPIHNPEWNI